jgi:histidyl-tRNA synthetase
MAGAADKTMSGKSQEKRTEARLPKGMRDIEADEIRAVQRMLGTIREVYESYGFEPLDTPAFEYTDCLGKFLPDQDRPNEGVFSFQDEDEQWLSLRYDLTAPLARYVAQNFDRLPKPFRRYQTGPVWRNEKPGPGRFRQFMQFDADTVGTESVAADAELCMLAADTLEALGLNGKFVIKVNNRKLLDGLMDAIGLNGAESASRRLVVLRAVDKLDRLGFDGVARLLGPGRLDESGAITDGAELDTDQINIILSFLNGGTRTKVVFESGSIKDRPYVEITSSLNVGDEDFYYYSNEDRVEKLRGFFSGNSATFQDGLDELGAMAKLFSAAGYDKSRIEINPSVVRGLEYYTGPIFEAELALVDGEDEQLIRFGSVGGGGRYDGLVARFKGVKVPATGFSVGVSRLYTALQALGHFKTDAVQGPVVVLVMDRDRVGDYNNMARTLREAGIRAEMYLGTSGMKAQMKYADRRGSPCVVIQGSDEKARGEVTIKDLIEGERLSGEIGDNAAWREGRPAQFAVKEGELVEAVRSVIARHRE